MELDAGWRELGEEETLQRGDEYFHSDGGWFSTLLIGSPAKRSIVIQCYRRRVEGPQQQITSLRAAVSESDSLRRILAKEDEHVAVIAANNIGRDKAVDVGILLRGMRDAFASQYRDRVFIVGDRVVDTDGGRYNARKAEVVSA